MLDFQNVNSTGFTILHSDGTVKNVTQSYNNGSGDGFVLFADLHQYRFSNEYVTVVRYDNVQHFHKVASTVWRIQHQLGRFPTTNVEVLIDGVLTPILPMSLQLVDANTIVINFSQPFSGRVGIR